MDRTSGCARRLSSGEGVRMRIDVEGWGGGGSMGWILERVTFVGFCVRKGLGGIWRKFLIQKVLNRV